MNRGNGATGAAQGDPAGADARERMRSPRTDTAAAEMPRARTPTDAARGDEAYGDYGHPGGGDRRAYGDMGNAGAAERGGYHDRARARGDEAYGDYGHPGGGDRRAYGDMGNTPTREGAPRGDGASRERRWRGGSRSARDVMTRGPRTVGPDEAIQRVAEIMVEHDTGVVPVVDRDQRLLGVITDRDIVCRLAARGVEMKGARAQDAMTDDVECVTEGASLHDVLRAMAEHQVRRVPVVARGDRLVGIIAMADIAREADLDEELQATFEEISSARSFWSRLR